MLTIEHISKTFNPGTITEKLALHNVSLHLDPGDFVTVIGGNGAVVGGEMGGYAECFAEFKTGQDANGEWRVEDVLVRSNYEGDGLGRTRPLCEELAREASR